MQAYLQAKYGRGAGANCHGDVIVPTDGSYAEQYGLDNPSTVDGMSDTTAAEARVEIHIQDHNGMDIPPDIVDNMSAPGNQEDNNECRPAHVRRIRFEDEATVA